jgi:two-component system cell cycle sensor histidine kinase/response regulator CckA
MTEMSSLGVLIVEDVDELRTLFATLLEMEGYVVYQAADGVQGLESLKANAAAIKMVITDLNLPKGGGLELIGKARTLNPAVKIIGTSGLSGDHVRKMVLEAGAHAFLPKPFRAKDALLTVRQVMEQS